MFQPAGTVVGLEVKGSDEDSDEDPPRPTSTADDDETLNLKLYKPKNSVILQRNEALARTRDIGLEIVNQSTPETQRSLRMWVWFIFALSLAVTIGLVWIITAIGNWDDDAPTQVWVWIVAGVFMLAYLIGFLALDLENYGLGTQIGFVVFGVICNSFVLAVILGIAMGDAGFRFMLVFLGLVIINAITSCDRSGWISIIATLSAVALFVFLSIYMPGCYKLRDPVSLKCSNDVYVTAASVILAGFHIIYLQIMYCQMCRTFDPSQGFYFVAMMYASTVLAWTLIWYFYFAWKVRTMKCCHVASTVNEM